MLYCISGRTSTIAARTLVRLGYTDVWNLEGGMRAGGGLPADPPPPLSVPMKKECKNGRNRCQNCS